MHVGLKLFDIMFLLNSSIHSLTQVLSMEDNPVVNEWWL